MRAQERRARAHLLAHRGSRPRRVAPPSRGCSGLIFGLDFGLYFCLFRLRKSESLAGSQRGPRARLIRLRFDCSSVSRSQRLVHRGWGPVHGTGKGRHRRDGRGRHGSSAAAGSARRGGGSMEAAGKRWRAARRPAGVRRLRHGWSCLLRGGALRARVRERAGHLAAAHARARPVKQQHEPTTPS